jgi:hypothetical protein
MCFLERPLSVSALKNRPEACVRLQVVLEKMFMMHVSKKTKKKSANMMYSLIPLQGNNWKVWAEFPRAQVEAWTLSPGGLG